MEVRKEILEIISHYPQIESLKILERKLFKEEVLEVFKYTQLNLETKIEFINSCWSAEMKNFVLENWNRIEEIMEICQSL